MPAGRPTKFKEEYIEQGYKLAREGLTDQKIADFFNVDKVTLERWKLKYHDFRDSVRKGKDEHDSEVVENSLLRRALGYEYVETTREISPRANPETGEAELRITKKVTKQVAPDVTAQIFWLKNRQPERWRDRTEMQHGGVIKLFAEPMKKPKDAGT